MFMKVYQYPSGRGNGSYWTLLSDGEEELKKALPLFDGLHPPMICVNHTSHSEPSTSMVKSNEKFVPVLPRSDIEANISYLSLGNCQSSYQSLDLKSHSSAHSINASDEFVVENTINKNARHFISASENIAYRGKENDASAKQAQLIRPVHLHDHNYAKELDSQEHDELTDEAMESVGKEMVELAVGVWNKGISKDDSSTSPIPKRKKVCHKSKKRYESTASHSGFSQHSAGGVRSTSGNSASFTLPIMERDTALHHMDSCVLTPSKRDLLHADVSKSSFSPSFDCPTTPKQGHSTLQLEQLLISDTYNQSYPYYPSPFTPLNNIFSPFHTDPLEGMKFNTPTNISPLGDLNSFGPLQPELCSLKVLDASRDIGNTPLRPGSLQAFGLHGLTPPP